MMRKSVSQSFTYDEAEQWQGITEEDERKHQRDEEEDRQLGINAIENEVKEEEGDLEEGWYFQYVNDPERNFSSEKQQQKEKIKAIKVVKTSNKMNNCKMWIANHLLFVSTSLSVVSLSDIQKAYEEDCHKNNQEPLNSNLLGRLIHQQFPVSFTSRLGSGGNQTIYYSKLQLKSNSFSKQQQEVNGDASSDSDDQDAKDTPSETQSNTPIKMSNEIQRDNSQKSQCKAKRQVSTESLKGLKYQRNSGFQSFQEDLVNEVIHPLPSEEDHDQDVCNDAAKRLQLVVNSLKLQGNLNILLKIFAHSSSCDRSSCSSLCRMFRRVRRHVVNARHPCKVMQLYSAILKLHVQGCSDDNCGIRVCPPLRASRQIKRGRDDDEFHHNDIKMDKKQDDLHHTSKRLNRQGKRPSTLMLRMPSSDSSCSESDGSTPSPQLSPSQILPRSPVRYSEKHGINFVPKICDQAVA